MHQRRRLQPRRSGLPEGKDRRLDDERRGLPVASRARSSSAPAPTSPRSTARASTASRSHYEGDGLLARCLQHETDHSHGTVFGDRINRARKKLTRQHDEEAEDFPLGWPADASREPAGCQRAGLTLET